MATTVFLDRRDAGRRLASLLESSVGLQGLHGDHGEHAEHAEPPVVVGMARGGVPVAFEIARALDAPLDVVVVRKLGHPRQPELGLGAIAEGHVRIMNEALVRQLGVTQDVIDAVVEQQEMELERRLRLYRGDRPPVPVEDRTVIVVDDGLATGFTARAAIAVMRDRSAARVVLAVPVGPPGAVAALGEVADDVVCVETTEDFFGLSEWYDDFRQLGDDDVARLLASAALGEW